MFLSDTLIGDLVAVVITFSLLLIVYFKWTYSYWSRQKVQFLEPRIPFGNLPDALQGREHVAVSLKKIYQQMKSRRWKYGGIYIFTKPVVLLVDLDLVRNIMTKDFQYFMDRDLVHNEKDPLQQHLLNLAGVKWRNMRSKLTPTFTSGKMKMMFNIMAECQGGLVKRMDQECLKKKPIDIKEVLACFTTNIIGSCAFGLEFNALEDENSEFRLFGKKMFSPSRTIRFKRTFGSIFPKLAKLLNMSFARKELVSFIMNMVEKTIDYREKNNYRRNDFMQLLIDLKNNKSENKEDHDGETLTMDELASQVVVFFAAGFETSSTLMTFAMYELSKSQDIQERLRKEINSVLEKHNNQITYDSIQDMTYLNQVIDETLRLHPPGALTSRKCVKDYKILNTDVVIEEGTTVIVPILGIHYDGEYYSNPTKFDPEHFSDENRNKRHNYAHLPFGEGPRNCIGMRFGLLQSKMGLVSLLQNYKFTINSKTREPLAYSPSSIVLSAVGDVWLNVQKL